jgi:hypothetical protein
VGSNRQSKTSAASSPSVVPVETIEEFVERPVYGFLEVEWIDESDVRKISGYQPV